MQIIDEKNEFNPCGDVISKPVCTDDRFVNNCCFNGGEKYVDAGCSDIAINDSDCTSDVRRFSDTSKCTNIIRDNSCIGPNVVKRVNDVT